jgi:hypothetical protein
VEKLIMVSEKMPYRTKKCLTEQAMASDSCRRAFIVHKRLLEIWALRVTLSLEKLLEE